MGSSEGPLGATKYSYRDVGAIYGLKGEGVLGHIGLILLP